MHEHRAGTIRRLLPGAAAPFVAIAAAGCVVVVAAGLVRGLAGDPDPVVLATYPVLVDGELGPAGPRAVDDAELLRLRDDRGAHRDAWELWRAVAPQPWETSVWELHVTTDGPDGALAAVVPEGDGGWILELDPADLAEREELEHTLVHELAHLISLASDQFAPDPRPAAGLVEAAERCAPTAGVEEGCLLPTAYLTAFVAQFWTTDDLRAADAITASSDPDRRAAEAFAQASDRFFSEYATTHPVEDFAESWATYVLYEWELEDPAAVWVQKAAFFDEYAALREARREIWASLGID